MIRALFAKAPSPQVSTIMRIHALHCTLEVSEIVNLGANIILICAGKLSMTACDSWEHASLRSLNTFCVHQLLIRLFSGEEEEQLSPRLTTWSSSIASYDAKDHLRLTVPLKADSASSELILFSMLAFITSARE
eukprot:6478266-Amphidinium_carterae.1